MNVHLRVVSNLNTPKSEFMNERVWRSHALDPTEANAYE